MEAAEVLRGLLLYFLLPLWLAAGFADYLCHRVARIEHTTGWRESALHLLQFGEIGIPILAALFLEINAAVISLMGACLILHELTALWDVSYANARRSISTFEQHVHSFLEILPLTAFLMVISLYWSGFISIFGLAPASFEWTLKAEPLPPAYIGAVIGSAVVFELLPFTAELLRGLSRRRLR